MDISSISFTNSVVFSIEASTVVELVVTGSVVASGDFGANATANVEGTVVVTVGVAVVEVVASSLCLD